MKEGWEILDFEKCLSKVPSTAKIPKKKFLEEGAFPIVSQEEEYINGYWDNEDDVFKVEKPVVLFGDHTKIVKLVNFDFVKGADGIKVFLPKEDINSKFFAYQLQSLELKDLGYARHYRLLKKKKISIPPLSEQKQIVAILDEAFEAIDQAIANIEKNIANAQELFQSKLDAVFLNKGNDWEEKKLGEIASVEYGYTDKSTTEGDFRYVRITDIDNNGKLISEDKKYIKYSKEAERFILKDKDLLMARTGATFAKVLLHNDVEPSIFASYLIRINFQEKIENELYWYFSKSGYYWKQANNLSSGAAQPHFNGAALKQVVFSYPKSIIEQQNLINIFRDFMIETQEIEAVYNKKILILEELKKSILQKAFAGELMNKEVEV